MPKESPYRNVGMMSHRDVSPRMRKGPDPIGDLWGFVEESERGSGNALTNNPVSDFVSDTVDTLDEELSGFAEDLKQGVQDITGYSALKEMRREARERQQRLEDERKEAERKREKAEKKRREEMRRRVREETMRAGHGGNIMGGGLLTDSPDMNPFADM